MRTVSYAPIGVIRTCFVEKFGVPRQSGMISEARGIIQLHPNPDFRTALNHLEDFSHLWIIFDFHLHQTWRPTIRPPRLDAPRRVGVFASRSPHRPNPIGMSAVKLHRVNLDLLQIEVSGVDLISETPVLDIKPYVPYADSISEAKGAWTEGLAHRYPVEYSTRALETIREFERTEYPGFLKLLEQVIELDPRPMSQKRAYPIEDLQSEGLAYGFRLLKFDVQWRIQNSVIWINELRVADAAELIKTKTSLQQK